MQLLADPYRKFMSGNFTDTKMIDPNAKQRLKVREFNDNIVCHICNGYMINPSTVDNCLHSYCRSCIVKHLLSNPFCPQCKAHNIKQINQINIANLKPDDALRALIYKLVPGLYKQERERVTQFASISPNGHQQLPDAGENCQELDADDDFFSPTELISLSLEYHPALLRNCSDLSQIPPVRYLQCPAGVKIHHLKRFLCSKFDIDPDNKQFDVEVIYEDEVLPNDFTLMDVGYCYSWQRHAPMKFTYRILLHGSGSGETQSHKNDQCNPKQSIKTATCNGSSAAHKQSPTLAQSKSVSFSEVDGGFTSPSTKSTLKSKVQFAGSKVTSGSTGSTGSTAEGKNIPALTVDGSNAPVKVVIARKAAEGKKQSPKRSHQHEETTFVASVTSDFKSLRSNDIRYSDYAVTSTTNFATPAATAKSGAPKSPKSPTVASAETASMPPVAKCDIVVSIPHSQMPKSPYAAEDSFENVSLAQLKTASKKAPITSEACRKSNATVTAAVSTTTTTTTRTTTAVTTTTTTTTTKNVPKLKIELSSLKARISIPKPKSADARFEITASKKLKYRKHSLDESRPTADRVDLETYVKNIGLKPIDVSTPVDPMEVLEKSKYSPNASPMSSCSSTTSSSNSNFPLTSSSEISSSSHKKRKKKHSKDSKEPRESSKRRKLHAEISSQAAKEPLKMKVKITPTPNHKSHKADSRRSSLGSGSAALQSPLSAGSQSNRDKLHFDFGSGAVARDNATLSALNRALCEESQSINKLMKHSSEAASRHQMLEAVRLTDDAVAVAITDAAAKQSKQNMMPKLVAHIKKDLKVPSSPPLPPSLFKTAPLAFSSLTASTTATAAASPPTQANNKAATTVAKSAGGSKEHKTAGLPSLKLALKSGNSNQAKNQHFAVPNPPRPIANSHRFVSTPSSIASAMNKQVGLQLKRSASLDESYTVAAGLTKKQKLEQDRIARKSAYGPFLGYTQTATNAKLNSSLVFKEDKQANATGVATALEIPFYAPISTTGEQEYKSQRKSATLVPSSISICKLSDSVYNAQTPSSTSAITIMARPRPTMTQSQQHVFSKPTLEIVRISSSKVPTDIRPLPPLSPPRGSRLMGPPTAMLKGKKSTYSHTPLSISSSSTKSPPLVISSAMTPSKMSFKTGNNSYRTSPPALINLRNTVPLIFPIKSSGGNAVASVHTSAKKVDTSKINGGEEKPKMSLREFRPTSKDGSIDILDLSSPTTTTPTTPTSAATPAGKVQKQSPEIAAGNNLEAALNKIKQNISSSTVADSSAAASSSTTKLQSGSGDTSSDDLQNLHLLSESATTREKIAIKTQLYEKPKLQQPSMVRQQNASVRNIPNPSALAFRNQPASLPTTPTAAASSTSPPPATPSTTQLKKSQTLSAATADEKTPLSASTPQSPNTTTSANTTTTTQSPPRSTKKPTTIDQVAANLNIRAAAAEASAAKASAAVSAAVVTVGADEVGLVNSTSAVENNNNNNKNKNNNNNNNNNSKAGKLISSSETGKNADSSTPATPTTNTAIRKAATVPTTTTTTTTTSTANTHEADKISTTPSNCTSSSKGSNSGSTTQTKPPAINIISTLTSATSSEAVAAKLASAV